ncbi:rhodanese-like domain-containing protein [Motilimonas sp. 1_MG-2023]|uniref:rhodanese-like domain-containing protein n=1 Tax=Motilimonas sp. 1_MG-2023 TaxID=3062672 RepID=UPI0026E41BD3|nr:rhodanese-like domain-containing protein [Motilimonas sp. 1_MG-2023]MDO6525757.1 rhodanese-like domain-containing protein [Motilimonas sp. 1_MG-2023]
MKALLNACLLTLIILFTHSTVAKNSVPVVSQSELVAWQQSEKPMQLLDVRTPAEFAQGHIKGAINIPYDQLDQQLASLDKDTEIVVYCRSGRRAAIAEDVLMSNGLLKVSHLEGDMLGWQAKGLPVEVVE